MRKEKERKRKECNGEKREREEEKNESKTEITKYNLMVEAISPKFRKFLSISNRICKSRTITIIKAI